MNIVPRVYSMYIPRTNSQTLSNMEADSKGNTGSVKILLWAIVIHE